MFSPGKRLLKCYVFHRKELSLALFIILVTLILSYMVYIRSVLASPPGRFFNGHPKPLDATVYLGRMLQGARRGVLYCKNHLTTESHEHAVIHNFYLVLGKMASLFHMEMLTMFHLARTIFGLLLLLYLYGISWRFFRKPYERLGFLIFCCFAGGFPSIPESNIFRSITLFPHFSAGIFFLTLYLYNFWRFCRYRSGLPAALFCTVSILMTGIIHPWNLVPMAAVSLALMLALMIRGRFVITKTLILGFFSMFIAALLMLILHLHNLHADPVLKAVSRQNYLPIRGIMELVSTFGFLWLTALAGAVMAFTRLKKSPMIFPALWFTATCAVIALPLGFQRRLFEGLQIPVCLLTIYFLSILAARFSGRFSIPRRLCTIMLLGIMLAVSLYSTVYFLVEFPRKVHFLFVDYYPPNGIVEDMHWIDRNLPEDSNVLSSFFTGEFIARYSLVNSYVVHPVETLDYERKKQEMYRFFARGGYPAEREAFLKKNNIHYVVHDAYSPFIQDFVPPSFLHLLYRSDNISVYHIK